MNTLLNSAFAVAATLISAFPSNSTVTVGVLAGTTLSTASASVNPAALVETWFPATKYKIEIGLATGEVANLSASDGKVVSLAIDEAAVGPKSAIHLRSVLARVPTELTFELESRSSENDIEQEVFAFNFSTQKYELLDRRRIGTSNRRYRFRLAQNPLDYVSSANEVRAKVTYRDYGAIFGSQWHFFLDVAGWSISP